MKKISMDAVSNACYQIAQKIKSESVDDITLAAVSRGGLIPCVMIAHLLGIKDIKFIRLSSYDDEHEQTQITDTTTDRIPDKGKTYIIDDICDSDNTLLYLRKKYPSAKIFTLVNKNPTITPDYSPITEPAGLWIAFPWEVDYN
ncbi:MAG: hypothetical protein J6Y91_00245 [Alphaproteobacteria bacterium]|nr:hypothetical protein [Alphaproteobacteria bacterium]